MGLKDHYGPMHSTNNNTVEPSIITRGVDAGKIPQQMKDDLAEFGICRAQCPECGSSNYYWDLPRGVTTQDCKHEPCNAILYISR